MRRVLVPALLAGAFLVARPARATPTRALGLGDMGRYVEDDTNVFTYPGLIAIGRSSMFKAYTHLVYVDTGGAGGVSPTLPDVQSQGLNGGAFLRLGDNIDLGLITSDYVATDEKAFIDQVAATADPGNQATFAALSPASALRRYDLMVGYALSDSFGAGLRLSYGSASQDYTPPSGAKLTTTDGKGQDWTADDNTSQHQFGLTLGASGLLDAGSAWDAGLSYQNFGFSFLKNGTAAFTGGGANGIELAGRFRFVLSNYWDLIPQVDYKGVFFSQLVEDSTVPAFGAAGTSATEFLPNNAKILHDRQSNSVDVGIAAALRASKFARFWVATGVQYTGIHEGADVQKDAGVDQDMTIDASLYSLPYLKFAFEATPLDWLILRAAVEKYTWSGSVTTYLDNRTANTTATTVLSGACGADGSAACGLGAVGADGKPAAAAPADFDAYVGASVLFHGFFVDLLIDNAFFTRGPYFLSGANGNLAARASIGAKF